MDNSVIKPIDDCLSNLMKYNDKPVVINNVQVAGNLSEKMSLPLSKRLSATDEEAKSRHEMEEIQRGNAIENYDAAANAYADEIIEKLLIEWWK